MGAYPKTIFAPQWMIDYIRKCKTPFEAVANRGWLFRTLGVRGL